MPGTYQEIRRSRVGRMVRGANRRGRAQEDDDEGEGYSRERNHVGNRNILCSLAEVTTGRAFGSDSILPFFVRVGDASSLGRVGGVSPLTRYSDPALLLRCAYMTGGVPVPVDLKDALSQIRATETGGQLFVDIDAAAGSEHTLHFRVSEAIHNIRADTRVIVQVFDALCGAYDELLESAYSVYGPKNESTAERLGSDFSAEMKIPSLSNLPPEMFEIIGHQLRPKDVVALARASKTMKGKLEYFLKEGSLTKQASSIISIEAFDTFLRDVEGLPPEFQASPMAGLRALPATAETEAIKHLVSHLESRPREHQAARLAQLVAAIQHQPFLLPSNPRAELFSGLFKAARNLPRDSPSDLLMQFAAVMPKLPWGGAFPEVLDVAKTLPFDEQLQMLTILVRSIPHMWSDGGAMLRSIIEAVSAIVDKAGSSPLPGNPPYESASALLMEAAKVIKTLPPLELMPMFENVLDAVKRLPSGARSAALTELTRLSARLGFERYVFEMFLKIVAVFNALPNRDGSSPLSATIGKSVEELRLFYNDFTHTGTPVLRSHIYGLD